MATQTMDYLEAIAHLPVGGTLIFEDISWEEYKRLLDDLGESRSVRVSYDRGRLEIVTTSTLHELYTHLLQYLARAYADETDSVMECYGSATMKVAEFKQGAEPDSCFYVRGASQVIGKRQIELGVDPPPDVIVEVDISHTSKRKFSFYGNLGVPEIWIFRRRLQIYALTEKGYTEAAESLAFPLLTGDQLTQFLEQGKTEGQSAALRAFRQWLQAKLQSEPLG